MGTHYGYIRADDRKSRYRRPRVVAADMIWETFQSASEYTVDTVAKLVCIPESG